MKTSGRQDFRSDINGLRAWAVIAVVLYHFGVPGVGGGFVGVDVFFVISGFLMYGIVTSSLMRGNFSIWEFYLARARRIFPALAVLCIVVLLFGWFFLMPKEYQQLGGQVRESLFFTSNLRYFNEAGYFDVASQEKWLLHTWSLSVEWQFYLLLPLLLAVLWKFWPQPRLLIGSVVIILCLSLIYCVWRTPAAPDEAFFLFQSRAWEMLAGALVYHFGLSRSWTEMQRWFCECIGIALILASIFAYDQHDFWPGWRALLPVTGAALVLLAARSNSIWTTSAPAQWVGTRSYSIYLWHWPLVVGLAYLEQLNNPLWVASAIAASLLLGHLSYIWIETPSRRRLAFLSNGRAAAALMLSLVLVAAFAQQVRRSGVPDRLPESIARVEAERKNDNPRIEDCLDPRARCIYGEEPVRAILIGDSHADAVVTAMQASLPGNKGGILFKGGSGCLVTFGMKSGNGQPLCEYLNDELEQTHETLYPGIPMVLLGRTSEYVQGGVTGGSRPVFYFDTPAPQMTASLLDEFGKRYVDTVCRLAKWRPLYLVRPIPEMDVDVPVRVGRAILLGMTSEVTYPLESYRQRHAFIWNLQDQAAERCGAQLLNPLDYLCDADVCYGNDKEGLPLYRDHDHLSESGNRVLIPLFARIFESQPSSVDIARN